jgi:hypothetical protein
MGDRAMQVWSGLAEIFGQTLLTNFGAEPPPLWRARIDELSDAKLANGLRNLSQRDSAFCPTLGQFVTACNDWGPACAPSLPSPYATGVDVSDLGVQLNLIFLRKLMRSGGRCTPAMLADAVRYLREVRNQLDEAYPRGLQSVQDRDDVAAMTPQIGAGMDRLLGVGGATAIDLGVPA